MCAGKIFILSRRSKVGRFHFPVEKKLMNDTELKLKKAIEVLEYVATYLDKEDSQDVTEAVDVALEYLR